jgi:hypothetical protein
MAHGSLKILQAPDNQDRKNARVVISKLESRFEVLQYSEDKLRIMSQANKFSPEFEQNV